MSVKIRSRTILLNTLLAVLLSCAHRLRDWLGRHGLESDAPWPYLLASIVVRLPPHAETLRRAGPYFPHIDLERPRLADLVRLPLQVAWLAIAKPVRSADRGTPGWLQRRTALVITSCLAAADRRWRTNLASVAPPAIEGRLDAWMASRLDATRQLPRWLALLATSGILVAAASVPLSPPAQALAAAAWLAALLVARRGGNLLRHAANGLALLMSARYIWWRIAETLPGGSQVGLTLAVLLVLAEIRLRLGETAGLRGEASVLGRATWLWAQATFVLAPPLVLLTGTSLIEARLGDLLIYALPHLLAWRLVDARRGVFHAVRRSRDLAPLAKVGVGDTATSVLGWANALAALSGFVMVAGSDASDSGLEAIFAAWALANLAYLGLSATLCERSIADDRQLAPSQTAMLTGEGLRRLARTAWTLPDRWLAPLRGWRGALHDWLPRHPAAVAQWMVIVALAASTAVPAEALAQAAEQSRRLSLKMLTNQNSLALRTTDGSASVYFGQRADELVHRVRLRLRYSHSPALLPRDSHIKVTLNDEVIGIAPIRKETDGRALVEEFEIDPRFITDRNELRFRFVGHYTQTCEDPLRNSLWAEISGASEIVIGYAPLVLQEDLSRLPEPFFDKRDLTGLTLPIVFAGAPGLPTLNAAGIVASWFGNLAGERGARFPVQADRPGPGHGIVVATNAERPAFMRGRPQVDGPTIEMMTNPADGVSKLLLILGRDGIDVAEAARALALGHVAMTGQKVTLRSRREIVPRQAYDAPNWARDDRPTRLGELIAYPQQLQAVGHAPPPVKLDLRVAPDLFAVGRRDIPMTLRYRYSPPMRGGDNLLTMSLNDQLVQSWSLMPGAGGNVSPLSRLTGNGAPLVAEEQRLGLPAQRIRGRNRLAFGFAFARHQEGPCPDVPPDDTRRALIDPESTIDVSRHHHFARMPNLNHFATAGFPFTKFADLSQTVVVMPDKPSREEVEAAMNLLGHFGRATGVTASQVRIVGPGDEAPMRDADLLVIGSAMGKGVLAQWPDYVPADVAGNIRRISQPARTMNFLYDWLGFVADPGEAIASQDKISAEGPLALIAGFRSPLSTTRSVVAITASAPDQLWQATNAIGDETLSTHIHGSVAFIRGTQVHSLRVGESYFVGELPWWVMIWFPLSTHPLLLALATIGAMILLTAGWLHWRARQGGTIQGEGDEDE